ncbi:MAG: nucleotide exchange factor GrpE [Acidobacteriia bacterium]|nr:nucleotide exchange factor GrpE [Terriglobia bacterium]
MDNEKEAITPTPVNPVGADEKQDEGREVPGASVEAAIEAPADASAALAKVRAERDALYERLLRKQAELENFRKRAQREKEDWLQHATADLVRALLPTIDAFERALRHRDANVPEEFSRGIELIHKQLTDVLARAGLTPIESLGKIFDPHLHQAVETVETKEHRDQEIVEELQRGYRLKHRLLRPAIVKVAVAPRGKRTPASPGGEGPTGESA